MANSVTDKVLEALLNGDELTALDSLERFGCMRLAARIYDLREIGWEIETETVETTNGKRFASYRLDPPPEF